MANNKNIDTEKWENATNKVDIDTIYLDFQNLKKNFNKFFHSDLYNEINKYYSEGKKIIEIGGQYGVSLLLQNNGFEKTLLDIDKGALDKASILAYKENQKIEIVHGDMYNMRMFKDETFDIVFNSGVLEHFDLDQRKLLLKEYSRILKKGGIMVIAVPNHYSKWYRIWYKVHVLLRQWNIPPEYKIYDMKEEINFNKLEIINRNVVSTQTIIQFYSWSFFGIGKIISIIMKICNLFLKLEGYLTILTIKKP